MQDAMQKEAKTVAAEHEAKQVCVCATRRVISLNIF